MPSTTTWENLNNSRNCACTLKVFNVMKLIWMHVSMFDRKIKLKQWFFRWGKVVPLENQQLHNCSSFILYCWSPLWTSSLWRCVCVSVKFTNFYILSYVCIAIIIFSCMRSSYKQSRHRKWGSKNIFVFLPTTTSLICISSFRLCILLCN